MVNLWFTEKDLRYRWSDVKGSFWESLEERVNFTAKELLEAGLLAERRQSIGVDWYGRGPGRRDYRNGYYRRDVVWKMGVLSRVLIPRSRQGHYRSQIVERYRRFGGSFDQYILKLFTLGLATRRVTTFFGEFFGECGFSSQTVSTILQRVSGELAEYHGRAISDGFRYLYLDGLSVTIRSAFKRQYVVLFALGEYPDGRREVLDYRVVPSEKGIYWQAFLDDLYRRGLLGQGLQLIVTDGAAGLLEAVALVYGRIPVQVCWIHRQRNLVSHLKHRCHRRQICADSSAIFQASSRAEALLQAQRLASFWGPKEPRAVKLFLAGLDFSLTFYNQPPSLWKKLASNNIIERFLREIRRRIRLVDSFRDEKSCERIIFTQVKYHNLKMS